MMKKKFLLYCFVFLFTFCGGVTLLSNVTTQDYVNAEQDFSLQTNEVSADNFKPEPYGTGYEDTMFAYVSTITSSLPTKYDICENHYLPCEDQSYFGMCATFAYLKQIENFIQINFGDYIDLSEAWISLNNTEGLFFQPNTQFGGGANPPLINNVFYNNGILLDGELPYEKAGSIGNNNAQEYVNAYKPFANKELIDSLFLNRFDSNPINLLKAYIREYGAVYTEIYTNGTLALNTAISPTSPYYNTYWVPNENDTLDNNHAVIITGFDDNYYYYNHHTSSFDEGAWICQNSWGENCKKFYVPYTRGEKFYHGTYLLCAFEYNNYIFDFSKSSKQNRSLYEEQNLYLDSSNSNYKNSAYSQTIINNNFSKDLFVYSDTLKNKLTYSYPASFGDNPDITVNITKCLSDVNNLFNITLDKANHQIIIEAKQAGLSYGNYKIDVIFENGTASTPIKYTKSFIVFSGAEISLINTDSLSSNILVNNKNTGITELTVYVHKNSPYPFPINIYFDEFAFIKNYTIETDIPEHALSSSFYTSNKYLYISYSASLQTELCKDIQITFTTAYDTNVVYTLHIYKYATNANLISISYASSCGETPSSMPSFAVLANTSSGDYSKFYLSIPSSTTKVFEGWYLDSAFKQKVSKDALGFYITYSNTKTFGTNYHFKTTSSGIVRTIILYAKFVNNDISYSCFTVTLSSDTFIYDGTEQTFSSVSVSLYGVNLILNTDFTVSYTNNINAGTEAKLTINGINNYLGERTITFSIGAKNISSADITVTTSNETFTYNRNEQKFSSVTVKDTTTGQTLSPDTDYKISYSNNTNAGTEAKLLVNGLGNYANTKTITFTIYKGQINTSGFTWTYSSALEYTGKMQSVVIGNLDLRFNATYSGNAQTDAGTYFASATIKSDDGNYYEKDFGTLTWIILPKTIDIVWCEDNFTYDGTDQSSKITASYKNVNNVGVALKITMGEFITCENAVSAQASFNNGETNYALPTATTKTFTMQKATYNLSNIKFESASFVADDKEHSITISGTLPNGVTVNYTNNQQTNAGKYTAIAKFSGDATNFNIIPDMEATLTIYLLKTINNIDEDLYLTSNNGYKKDTILNKTDHSKATLQTLAEKLTLEKNQVVNFGFKISITRNNLPVTLDGTSHLSLTTNYNEKNKVTLYYISGNDVQEITSTLNHNTLNFDVTDIDGDFVIVKTIDLTPKLIAFASGAFIIIVAVIIIIVKIAKNSKSRKENLSRFKTLYTPSTIPVNNHRPSREAELKNKNAHQNISGVNPPLNNSSQPLNHTTPLPQTPGNKTTVSPVRRPPPPPPPRPPR